ncbi:MAG: hypothetical protein ACKVOH_01350 [Chlamydiales bacterium]
MTVSDEVPPSQENKIPKFLHIIYIAVLLWGLIAFYLYWNGSHGFLDRGYWKPLQKAAETTFPFEKAQHFLET